MVATTTLPVLFATGIHASRPAASAVGSGGLYSCTTHSLVYQTDGVSTWSTWATLGTGTGTLSDQGVITYLDGTVAAAPATPAAGKLRLYAKTGKVLAVKDDAGVETVLGSGGSTSVTTKGDLQGYSTVAARIPVGTDTQVLTADSTQTLGVKWAAGGGGTDLVQTASGAGSVRIPGLAGSADIPPAVAGTLDDEFDTTDTTDPMTGWTTLQTPTTHDINSTVKGHYYVKKTATAATTGNVGIYKAWTPSAAQSVYCKVSDAVVSKNNYQTGAMLFVSTATPGALECIRLFFNGTNIILGATAYSALGTPASALVSHDAHQPQLYFKVLFNSSTSINWYFSHTGKLWSPLLIAHNPGFTIGSVGIAIDTQQATTDGEAIFDWFRSSF